MMTMHFRPLVVWKRFFFLSSSQVQKKGLCKRHTPTTNSIKYDDSKRFSLSPSLSLPLSSRKRCTNKRCSKKHYCRCSFVLLREHHRVDSGRIQRVCVCPFFYVHTPPTRLHTSDSRVCFNRCSFLCVVLSSRPQKKKKKRKKKKRIFFNGRIYHTNTTTTNGIEYTQKKKTKKKTKTKRRQTKR